MGKDDLKISVWTILLICLSLYFIFGTYLAYDNYKYEVTQNNEAHKEAIANPPNYSIPLTDMDIMDLSFQHFSDAIDYATEEDYYHRYFLQGSITLVLIFLTIISWRIDLKKKV